MFKTSPVEKHMAICSCNKAYVDVLCELPAAKNRDVTLNVSDDLVQATMSVFPLSEYFVESIDARSSPSYLVIRS